jgi:BirA family biotin operon repressor/biotin-[acetyl-CoA-carboxylase] ligase
LPNAPLAYTPESLHANLRTSIIGRRIELHEQVGSTNDLARLAGRRGEAEGLVIIAEEQLAGRGRLGRTWMAPPGCCVLCSVLLRPNFPPQQAFYLTIAASLAIYRATAPAAPVQDDTQDAIRNSLLSIKWPNDVLVRGRKVAGILSESEFRGSGWDFAVVGFGINANLSAKDLGHLGATATSLSIERGEPVDRTLLLARVLAELEGLYLVLQGGHFSRVHDEWAAVLETIGREVTVSDGAGTVKGKALRVDPDGALVVLDGNGRERRVLAGDVS